MNQFSKNLALWLVIGLIMVALFQLFSGARSGETDIIFSQFVRDVEDGRVSEVVIRGDRIRGRYNSGRVFHTYALKDPDLIKLLRSRGVSMRVEPQEPNSWYVNLLMSSFPM
ncbi:MAG: ATP-dependent metallopeptidase FtsH/Yme1/Tma family protein, partial [Nitrospinota bacterium]